MNNFWKKTQICDKNQVFNTETSACCRSQKKVVSQPCSPPAFSHRMVGVGATAGLIDCKKRTTPAGPASKQITKTTKFGGIATNRLKKVVPPSIPFLSSHSPYTPNATIILRLPSMAAATEGFIHLSRPLAPATAGLQTNLAPLSVNIQPQVAPLRVPTSPARLYFKNRS